MYSGLNAIANVRGSFTDEKYYFAGHSAGYQTKYQTNLKTLDDEDTDAYVISIDFNASADQNQCLYQEDVTDSFTGFTMQSGYDLD